MANFFVGDGVFNFKGKDYATGEQLPDSVPAETIARLKAKNKVSETPAQVIVVASDQTDALRGQIAMLNESLDDVTASADRNATEVLRLQGVLSDAQATIATQATELETAQATITTLTAQISGAPAAIETEAAAAPAADVKVATTAAGPKK
jgi:chromosome segregation ATPase